ncbi:MAG: glycosyltransferase family 4 protein [Candidatus Azambacteria bacterium]|nr:glycosyltransferase family 4 protein [Candidatus Azambacteria bacterium]
MFGWELPPHNSGGLGVACYNLAKALCEKHAEVIFVLPQRCDDVSSDAFRVMFASDAVKVVGIRSPLVPYLTAERYKILIASGELHHFGDTLLEEVMRYGVEARRIAEHERFDVIHAHDWLSFPAGVAAKQISGKSLIAHVHATEFDRTGGQGVNQGVYEIEKWGMEQADKVVAVSRFTKDMIVAKYGISPEKVEVVHNAVDDAIACGGNVRPFSFPGKSIVLFVGRMTLQKGPDYFVAAARKVLEQEKNIVFVMAGDGDMYHAVIEQAARLGIAEHFSFTGFIRGKELARLYRSADIFVMPSISEPFGLTALEALKNRAPVLISRQTGVGEVLSHCLKVDFWDVDEMAAKILAVVRYKELGQCLSDNGYEEVSVFTWGAVAEQCIRLYRSLMPSGV